MSDVSPGEAPHTARNGHRRLSFTLAAAAILCLGIRLYSNHSASVVEASALQYIRLNGSTSEGYRHNLVSSILSFLPQGARGRPLATQPIAGVSFPRDRLNDYMANELLKIRNLDSITLYPPDPHGQGIDYTAKSVTRAASLKELDLQLSTDSIYALEEKFPKLVILLVDHAGTDATGDATNKSR
ncbi:MAG: hypothetical protein RIK87_27830 [Fuerstiella sp.]